ncbi:MAG: hypothetical protein V3R89_05005, partial [Thermoanaerobaculia bacterium]
PFYLQGQAPVALPEGVTRLAWEVEKVKWQNSRIRAFLGCIHLLEVLVTDSWGWVIVGLGPVPAGLSRHPAEGSVCQRLRVSTRNREFRVRARQGDLYAPANRL